MKGLINWLYEKKTGETFLEHTIVSEDKDELVATKIVAGVNAGFFGALSLASTGVAKLWSDSAVVQHSDHWVGGALEFAQRALVVAPPMAGAIIASAVTIETIQINRVASARLDELGCDGSV